jgi:glycosyltransferase involved in cell wall biosynthesis
MIGRGLVRRDPQTDAKDEKLAAALSLPVEQSSPQEAPTMKVSALILTYNHERFIEQAIDGFLIQKTDFPCELVIVDDCSTDGTRDIMRRYWEKYPDRIRVVLNRHNIGGLRTVPRAYHACRGQYVAWTEGDDYWTSPDKLQRQVDLLDRHPEYAMCFHSVQGVWDDGSHGPVLFRPPQIKDRYTLRDLARSNFIGSCSTMYRRGMFGGFPAWYYQMPVGDWCQHILHAQHGDIGYMDEPMAVYRQHSGGVYSLKPATYRMRIAVEMLRRFRCVLGRESRGEIDYSLCKSYCALILQYCDEGKLAEARQCLGEYLREMRPSRHIPATYLLNVVARLYTPGFHRLCKRVFKATLRGEPARRPPARSAASPSSQAASSSLSPRA